MSPDQLRLILGDLKDFITMPNGVVSLRQSILQLAVSGKLVPQDPSEGTGEELYEQIQAKKQELIKQGKLKKQKPLPPITEEEIPFEIPKTWKWVRLGEIVTTITPPLKLRTSQYLSSGAFPVVDQGKGLIAGYTNSDKVILSSVDQPTVVFGDHTREVKFVTFDFVAGADGTKVLNPFIDARYFYWATVFAKPKSMGYSRHYKKLIVSLIPLPPLKEQSRIAKVTDNLLSKLADVSKNKESVELSRKVFSSSALNCIASGDMTLLTKLRDIVRTKDDCVSLRQSILQLAVSGKLVPQDPSEGTGEELYEQIQAKKQELIKQGKLKKQKPLPPITEEEIPFEIPKTWKWVRLGEIGLIVGGGTPSTSVANFYCDPGDGIAWLTPADMRGAEGIYISRGKKDITEEGLLHSSAQLMPTGTVLFSSRAPIGYVAIANNPISTNQGFKSFISLKAVSEYIYYWLLFYGPTIDRHATGTTFREVSGSVMRSQLIPLPPAKEQSRIVGECTDLMGIVDDIEGCVI